VPVVIVTGGDDQIANAGHQSERLHQKLPGSEFIRIPGAGHMIHHSAPDQVVAAVDRVVAQLATRNATVIN
jgi:pimeloyl-ACP methyl ester carboxylesterase